MADKELGLQAIRDLLGDGGYIDTKPDLDSYQIEWRGLWTGQCDLVAKPNSTQQVSQILSICNTHGIAVVPQGGNTGLVGGGVPNGGIVVTTERLNKIRAVDPINFTLSCDAGCILKTIQTEADNVDRLFPLSLGAEGSCQIGGNLSTNAGGVQVLKYGNARELVLGLEAVLPDGRIWDGMRSLRKDNTGYDLKHLFMGAEGTLGIITGAVLKLFPKPRQKETCLVSFESVENCVALFTRMSAQAGDALSAFEAMNGLAVEMTVAHGHGVRDPFEHSYPWYALMELTSPREGNDLRTAMETILESAFEDGIVLDGVIAESGSQSDDFWRIRELIPECQAPEGASIKNDVSIPISRVADFINLAHVAVENVCPGIRFVSFGHIGDGNFHYNLTQPKGSDRDTYLAQWHDITDPINDIVHQLNGSFSAEHGIGQLKRDELERYRSDVELSIMKTVKKGLDPNGIMNPGKIFKD